MTGVVQTFGRRIEQSTLKQQVLAVLRKNLVTGDLVEGTLYSASAIALDLGVSTSPVREALLTLVDQGVMEAVRNRGYRVLPLGERDRSEIHEMRALLEIPSMVRLAHCPDLVPRIREFAGVAGDIVAAAADGDVVAYLELDLAFHLGLLGVLGNDRLVAAVRTLRDQTRQLKLTALVGTDELERMAHSHVDIVEALASHDGPRVEQLMVDHLEHIRTDWHSQPGPPARPHRGTGSALS